MGRDAAQIRAASFRSKRLPKFLRYLEHNLERNDATVFVGDRVTYVDLAAFQVVEGLSYAFPRTFKKLHGEVPRLLDLHARIGDRPRIATYLESDRRYPFSDQGIFRKYPELDVAPTKKKPRPKAKRAKARTRR